jgi:CrtC N-terminal lipocalin domain
MGNFKWRLLESAVVAALVREWYSRNRTVQITPVGMFESRCREDLNRGLRPADDAQHPYKNRFYWEWWYFDAHFDDGHRCVLELQTPNIVNMFADECAMLFNIYTPDGVEHNNIVPFPGSQWRSSTETCDVAIGDNTIKGYFPEYSVKFKHDNLACDLKFENLLPGWTRGSGEIMFGQEAKHQLFGWVVAQPRAKVTGTISVDGVEHQVTGLGYHDHNWGSGALPMYVSHWIWGRLSTDRVTMIFADITTTKKCGGVRVPLVFLALDGQIVLESARADCQSSNYLMDSKGFQVYPAHVDFQFAERDVEGDFHFDVTKELEMINTLAEKLPDPLVEVFGRAIAAPVYYRFLSDYSGTLKVGDEVLDLTGETHWEYMVMNLRRGKVPKAANKIRI